MALMEHLVTLSNGTSFLIDSQINSSKFLKLNICHAVKKKGENPP